MNRAAPVIGITSNLLDGRYSLRPEYEAQVRRAGGTPILLCPPTGASADPVRDARAHLDLCDAIILSGGDDPDTGPFGAPTHPQAKLIDPARQRHEIALLEALLNHPDTPVLGICLGMQLMALSANGSLDQHMPSTLESHDDHVDDRLHSVLASIDGPSALTDENARPGDGLGQVTSWHRQCVVDPGSLRTIARASDGVIEAIDDPARAFYLGVQWHPERTHDPALGHRIFEHLIAGARRLALQPALR